MTIPLATNHLSAVTLADDHRGRRVSYQCRGVVRRLCLAATVVLVGSGGFFGRGAFADPAAASQPAPALAPKTAPPAAAQVEPGNGAAASGQHHKLGRYEAEALARALARTGLRLDETPLGKRVAAVHVVNLDVFGPGDGLLRWLNVFHVTSQRFSVAREVLIQPGDPWNQDLVDETIRKLKDPVFTTLAVVVPVVSETHGAVDVLVVTRDIWSLRLNSNYEIQEDRLTFLTLSLSENNLFGLRKQAAFVFQLDQGTYRLGPLYNDKNIAGTRLQLRGTANAIFNRQSSEAEGSESSVSLTYPLWSLERAWGGSLLFGHHDAIDRIYQGAGLLTYDSALTPEDDEVPFEWNRSFYQVETQLVRSFGRSIKHNVTVSHSLEFDASDLPDGAVGNAAVLEEFRNTMLPRSERSSALAAQLRAYTPSYRTYRDIDTYDLGEDFKVGPDGSVTVGSALRLIGSENDYLFARLGLSYTHDLKRDGYVQVSGAASTRRQGGAFIDNLLSTSVRVYAPKFANVLRPVLRTEVASRVDAIGPPLLLGGSNGLRGYIVGAFRGDRRLVANLELRTTSARFLFSRWGAVAFWDVGGAAASLSSMAFAHDLGVGIRALIPQLSPLVYRFDFAVPLTGPTAGALRFVASFDQAF